MSGSAEASWDNKPEVIITHESDLDGLLAGVLLQRLAKKLFGTTSPAGGLSLQFLETARPARTRRVGRRTSPLNRAWTRRTGSSLTITSPSRAEKRARSSTT